VALAVALSSLACAKARNYADPLGPILVARAAPAGEASRSSADIRVVTFNVKFARHVDRAIDLLARPGPLRGADILMLEEMDGPGSEQVASALGMNLVYVPSAFHPAAGKDFGVAILSPWPLTEARKVALPHEHRFRKLRRAAASATVHLPSGPVRAYGVHLEAPAGLGGGGRRDQIRAILADAAGWSGPIVVAGDLNGTGPARELEREGFLWASYRVHDTIYFFDFDHVLARGLCYGREPAAGAAEDVTDASDHDPVWAVLRPCEGARADGRDVRY
jgi:endonuclease/exonuclease/phosphatase family metal-dependent hydrolase